MNKIFLGMVLIILAIVVIACVSSPTTPVKTPVSSSVETIDIGDIQRYVDEEARVVCWIYDGYYSGWGGQI